MKKLLLFLIILSGFGCRSQKKLNTLQLSDQNSIEFLDSLTATQVIIKDDVEHFFDHIQKVDMSIQMKKNYPAETSRESVLNDYKSYLQKDVANFSDEEIIFVKQIWSELYPLVNQLGSAIFPEKIRLIKTHANHYGASVYYTRENCIVIPKYVMEAQNKEPFRSTMLHELFHIYSRYNPETRDKLYKLIGFSKIGNPRTLLMLDSLKERVLLNPDGINYAYAIQLNDSANKDLFAIPLIISNEFDYTPSKPRFFDYLAFNLFEVAPPYAGKVKVISKNNGDPTINFQSQPSFFKQIRDNTGYIIHPDEIMADNFTYLCFSKEDETYTNRFSEEGKKLIKLIEEVILE